MSDTPCPKCKGKCCVNKYGNPAEHGTVLALHSCPDCQDGTSYVPQLLLWLLTQTRNKGYDTYDSCVVAATSADEAKKIHPMGGLIWESRSDSWARDIEDVTTTYLGIADSTIKRGVVCASFNAG